MTPEEYPKFKAEMDHLQGLVSRYLTDGGLQEIDAKELVAKLCLGAIKMEQYFQEQTKEQNKDVNDTRLTIKLAKERPTRIRP